MTAGELRLPRYRSKIIPLLKERGLKNMWFCRRMGVSRMIFYAVERGARPASPTYRMMACEILGVDHDTIFERVEPDSARAQQGPP